ncbi:hypothetical protein KHA80_00840 [Anaerobacillus sp. HL2]|nr:hypothetical protein KHA80_00840 [Anaerobacillus sp. HL2]
MLNTIIDNEIDYYEPRTGDEFQIGSLHIQILSPDKLTGDLNAGSISLIATYGEVSICLLEDAEQRNRKKYYENDYLLKLK